MVNARVSNARLSDNSSFYAWPFKICMCLKVQDNIKLDQNCLYFKDCPSQKVKYRYDVFLLFKNNCLFSLVSVTK